MTDWLRRIAGVLKHLWLTAGGLLCRQGPLSASRWKFGVWIGPRKVLLAPKPTSSEHWEPPLEPLLPSESRTANPLRCDRYAPGGSARGSTSPCAAAERRKRRQRARRYAGEKRGPERPAASPDTGMVPRGIGWSRFAVFFAHTFLPGRMTHLKPTWLVDVSVGCGWRAAGR
jgi:hypothetical protein